MADEGSIATICSKGKSQCLQKEYETKTNILPDLSASNGNTQNLVCLSNSENENTLEYLTLKCKYKINLK